MRKVLIVEDDSNISKALEIRIKANGFLVSKASDAVFAMSEIVNRTPDVVVLDINLPGGSGLTVAERMRDNPLTANVPVIFITASKKSGLRQEAGNLNAAAFLEKPFSSTDLMEAIVKATGQRQAA